MVNTFLLAEVGPGDGVGAFVEAAEGVKSDGSDAVVRGGTSPLICKPLDGHDISNHGDRGGWCSVGNRGIVFRRD